MALSPLAAEVRRFTRQSLNKVTGEAADVCHKQAKAPWSMITVTIHNATFSHEQNQDSVSVHSDCFNVSISPMPDNPVTAMPTNPVTAMPANPVTARPTNPVTTMPANPVTAGPANSVTTRPANSVTTRPANSVTTRQPILLQPGQPTPLQPDQPTVLQPGLLTRYSHTENGAIPWWDRPSGREWWRCRTQLLAAIPRWACRHGDQGLDTPYSIHNIWKQSGFV